MFSISKMPTKTSLKIDLKNFSIRAKNDIISIQKGTKEKKTANEISGKNRLKLSLKKSIEKKGREKVFIFKKSKNTNEGRILPEYGLGMLDYY